MCMNCTRSAQPEQKVPFKSPPVLACAGQGSAGSGLCDHQLPFPWCPVVLLEPSHPSLILICSISSLAGLKAAEWGREPPNQTQLWCQQCQGTGRPSPTSSDKKGLKKSETHCSPEKGIKNEASVLWVITGPWQMWSYQPLTGAANKDPFSFFSADKD